MKVAAHTTVLRACHLKGEELNARIREKCIFCRFLKNASLLLALLIVACTNNPRSPLTHEAYIWQRQWTPALDASIDAASGHFTAWRVLALESKASGELVDTAPHFDVIVRSDLPVIAVMRLNGSRPPPSVEMLAGRLRDLASKWRVAGVKLIGVEVDHDCATAQLDRYADLLTHLRTELPPGLTLSITVLPTWIGAPVLSRLLAAVDTSVLQVHAVSAPQPGQVDAGLFDAQRARGWIAAYSTLAPHPFRVALPAYGVRVGFDDEGRAVAVASEMARDISAAETHELRVAPKDVAGLLRDLQTERPHGLIGITWFRLPSEDDRRAWSLATLHAVIDGAASLETQLALRLDATESGVRDVVVLNRGAIDAPLPALVIVQARACSAVDALAGFRVESQPDGRHFVQQNDAANSDAILRAGRERRIGWLRCDVVGGATLGETRR